MKRSLMWWLARPSFVVSLGAACLSLTAQNVTARPWNTSSKSPSPPKGRLLEPWGIRRFSTDGWGAYERHIDPEQHEVGKANTQKIESKHLNLRTRIKRLVRRTICFSKTTTMHDLVIGLFINRYEFGVVI